MDLHADVELLSPHVPHALVRHRLLLGAAAVLQPRRGQDPALDLHQSGAHVDAKGLDEGVVIVVRAPHEVAYLPLPVGGRPGGRLYHRRSLQIGQLLHAPLAGHNVAYLHGQVGVLVLLADLKAREVGEPQLHLVSL